MKNKLYHIIFAAIMVVLLLPVVQEVGGFKCLELDGYVEPTTPVKPSFSSYRDFSLQDYCKQLAKEKLGFKSLFVRSYNQVLHSFFHESSNQNLIRGKQGHYFLKQYTDDVTGVTLQQRFGSVDSAQRLIPQNIQKVLLLMDSLKQHNTQLLIVLAPSKTAIYPEYLPDSLLKRVSSFSLQEAYGQAYCANGIPTLDFISLFKKMKTDSQYPLYTRYGTHWNAGTVPFVCDTLLQRIGDLTHQSMPHIKYLDSNISKQYVLKSDYELESTANLLFRMKHDCFPNPTFQLTKTSSTKKPRLLVVADSYYTQLEGSRFEEAFKVVDYWKYNEEAYSTMSGRSGKVELLDRYKTITEADVIIIMYTSMFAYDHLFSFPEMALQVLKRGDHFDKETAIQNVISRIKSDPTWYESVKKQAKERHISIEQSLRDNAEYVIDNEK